MAFVVQGPTTEGKFTVIVNDINVEATVTERSEIAAAWALALLQTLNRDELVADRPPNANPRSNRRLIVGITTIDVNGAILPPPTSPPRRDPGTPFFGNTAPIEIVFPDGPSIPLMPIPLNPGDLRTPAPFFPSSATSSNAGSSSDVFPPEIEEIGTVQSAPSLPNPKSKAPMEPGGASSSAVGESSAPNLATLQLCCGDRCLIFSLLHNDQGIPDALVSFLFDRDRVTLIGAGVCRDGNWLGRPRQMLVYRDPWELGESRAWRGLQRLTTLDQLAGKLLGREMAVTLPPVRSWDGWPLTANQTALACLDVYRLSELGEKLVGLSMESFACPFMRTLRVLDEPSEFQLGLQDVISSD